MADKQAQALIKHIKTNKSTTYCARIDTDNLVAYAAKVNVSCADTVLLLCCVTPTNLKVLATWPKHIDVPNNFQEWITLSAASIACSHHHEVQVEDRDSFFARAFVFDFEPLSEQSSEKAADQLLGNANALLKKWKLIVDDEEDEHEYNFDDI